VCDKNKLVGVLFSKEPVQGRYHSPELKPGTSECI